MFYDGVEEPKALGPQRRFLAIDPRFLPPLLITSILVNLFFWAAVSALAGTAATLAVDGGRGGVSVLREQARILRELAGAELTTPRQPPRHAALAGVSLDVGLTAPLLLLGRALGRCPAISSSRSSRFSLRSSGCVNSRTVKWRSSSSV